MFSLSVTLVSITNQKEYGNIGWGISLIGPRMSSVSIGWMLLQYVRSFSPVTRAGKRDKANPILMFFVRCLIYSLSFATFSQALFPDTLWLYYVCKGIIYFTGIIGCTHLIVSEVASRGRRIHDSAVNHDDVIPNLAPHVIARRRPDRGESQAPRVRRSATLLRGVLQL
jgi:hypothetical protein